MGDGCEQIISRKGGFTLKSLYIELVNYRSFLFPCKGIWILDISSKVSFFLWNAYLDKILTLDHL